MVASPLHTPVSIGPLRDDERSEAVQVLANAFRDNPLNVAAIRARSPERRVRSNAYGMRSLLPVAQRHASVLAARTGERVAAVLVGVPPFAFPLPPPPLGMRLRCLLGQGFRVARRWNEAFEALEARHPEGPHAYLSSLGVDPNLQGQGFGSALLAHWLAELDADGTEAYLETDRATNIGFYTRFGFEGVGEADVLGAHVWLMGRRARA